jgi:hypothetical protein
VHYLIGAACQSSMILPAQCEVQGGEDRQWNEERIPWRRPSRNDVEHDETTSVVTLMGREGTQIVCAWSVALGVEPLKDQGHGALFRMRAWRGFCRSSSHAKAVSQPFRHSTI